jgi:hypothetical protein
MINKMTKWLLMAGLSAGLSAAFSAHAVGKPNQAGPRPVSAAQKAYQDYLANPAMSASLFTDSFTTPKSFLDAKGFSSADDAEYYIAEHDPVTGPRYNCAKIDSAGIVTLTHNGVSQLLEPAGETADGYQLQLFWTANGQAKSEIRSIKNKVPTRDNQYVPFNPFEAAPTNVCLEFQRVGSVNTFDKWRDKAFGPGNDGNLESRYFNTTDLAFGRRVVGGKVGNNTFMYVMNFVTLDEAVAWKPTDKLNKVIAIVALEHSNGILKFSIFEGGSAKGARRPGADLDTEGVKYLPNVCAICHNNNFIPIDVLNQTFSNVVGSRLVDQQGMIKQFNQLMIEPQNVPEGYVKELVEGWYAHGNDVQKTDFVPGPWAADAQAYLNIIGPNCRTCHITQQYTWLGNSNMVNSNARYFARRVCETDRPMPNSRVTHNAFFASKAPRLFQTLTNEPIPCIPSLVENLKLTPSRFDKAQNSNVNFSYAFTVDQPVARLERQVVSPSYSGEQCFNMDTGAPETCRWTTWSGPVTSSTRIPYQYNFSGQINPAIAYANWKPGQYVLRVRGVSPDDNPGTFATLNFTIDDSRPVLSSFIFNPATISKSNVMLINASYTLSSNVLLNGMQRKITRNGQCINPNTGQPGSQCWYDWTVLTTASKGNPYLYSYSIALVPATAYANWPTGSYNMEMSALAEGFTLTRSLGFSIAP